MIQTTNSGTFRRMSLFIRHTNKVITEPAKHRMRGCQVFQAIIAICLTGNKSNRGTEQGREKHNNN